MLFIPSFFEPLVEGGPTPALGQWGCAEHAAGVAPQDDSPSSARPTRGGSGPIPGSEILPYNWKPGTKTKFYRVDTARMAGTPTPLADR